MVTGGGIEPPIPP